MLAVKDNQPTLVEDVKLAFKQASAEVLYSTETVDEGHGRVEVREYCQCLDLSSLRMRLEWRGLRSLCKVVSYRFTSDGEKSAETRYYISSLGAGVKRLASAIRPCLFASQRLFGKGVVVPTPCAQYFFGSHQRGIFSCHHGATPAWGTCDHHVTGGSRRHLHLHQRRHCCGDGVDSQ